MHCGLRARSGRVDTVCAANETECMPPPSRSDRMSPDARASDPHGLPAGGTPAQPGSSTGVHSSQGRHCPCFTGHSPSVMSSWISSSPVTARLATSSAAAFMAGVTKASSYSSSDHPTLFSFSPKTRPPACQASVRAFPQPRNERDRSSCRLHDHDPGDPRARHGAMCTVTNGRRGRHRERRCESGLRRPGTVGVMPSAIYFVGGYPAGVP